MSPIYHQRDQDDLESSPERSQLVHSPSGRGTSLLSGSKPRMQYARADTDEPNHGDGSRGLMISGGFSGVSDAGTSSRKGRKSVEGEQVRIPQPGDIDAYRIGGSRFPGRASDRMTDELAGGDGEGGMDEVDAFLAREANEGNAPSSGRRLPYTIAAPPSGLSRRAETSLIDSDTPQTPTFPVPDGQSTSSSHTSPPSGTYPPSQHSRHSLSNDYTARNGLTHSSTMSLDLARRFKDIVTKPFTPEKGVGYSPQQDREPLELDGMRLMDGHVVGNGSAPELKDGYEDRLLGLESPGLSPEEQDIGASPLISSRAVRAAQYSLAVQATPSLLLSLVGLIFTGQLIDHLARWQVFKRVDELFILVPIIGNLKGNLEMCLAARLSTFAAQGLLDTPKLRHSILTKSLLSLQLQALVISALAGFLSFSLGFFIDTAEKATGTDTNPPPDDNQDGLPDYASTPGGRELVLMLATAMIAASLTSAILGGFMSWLIVACRWMGVDPDNVAAPLAACLGDLLTVFVLALIGTVLAQHFRVGLPIIGLVAAILATLVIGFLVRRLHRGEVTTYRNKPADQEQLGWSPLVVAMFLSCGTGLVLDASVNKYKGFALMGLTMTGIAGSIGAIHGSRLSTTLHGAHREATPMLNGVHLDQEAPISLTASQAGRVLFWTAWPVQLVFVLFAAISGWLYIDFRLLVTFMVVYAMTVLWSIVSAHKMTQFFWSKDLDPDSYTLPIHSALVDVIGQILLVVAFEVAAAMGADVKISAA